MLNSSFAGDDINLDKAMDKTPKTSDKNVSLTPSATKLARILGDSPTPRMLTPYEIKLLRQSTQETAQVVREILERKRDKSQDRKGV